MKTSQIYNKDIIVCIDPSFTRTGVFVSTLDGVEWVSKSFSKEEGAEVYDLTVTFAQAKLITKQIKAFIDSLCPLSVIFVIEYPVMATRSGSYLGVLSTTLNIGLRNIKMYTSCSESSKFYWLPPGAIPSILKIEKVTKTVIVELAKAKLGVKLNHDEATAYILYTIYKGILSGSYKNSYKLN